MARKRQDPQPLDADGVWKEVLFYGLIQVPVEIDLSMAVGDFLSYMLTKMRQKPEGTEETIDEIRVKVRAVSKGVEIFREILAKEIQGKLRFAVKQAVERTSQRALVEGERRGVFTRKLIHQGRGRKPGSKQSSALTVAKVRRRIGEMEEAERRIAKRKNPQWSWAALAKTMNLKHQTLLAYAKKYPVVREKGEEILRRQGCKF